MSARIYVRSGSDSRKIIVDRCGRKATCLIPPKTEFVVVLCFVDGIPFVGLMDIREDGETEIHDIGLDDVILLRSKMVLRGEGNTLVGFDILNDLRCTQDFDLVLRTAKLVFDNMTSRKK